MSTSELPPGVLRVRLGPGANCSSAGSAIDILFCGAVLIGAVAVALAAALPRGDDDGDKAERDRRESGAGPEHSTPRE